MCRAALRWFAVALAAVLCTPGATPAQQTEQALIQHLDSLMPLLDQARKDAEAAEEARRREIDARQPTEALDVGLLHVLVPPGRAAPALDVIGTVWERDYAPFVDRSPALELDRIYFQWAVDLQDFRPTTLRLRKVEGGRWRSRAYMEEEVRRVIGESLKTDLESSGIRAWPVGSVSPPLRPESIYRQVAVAPSRAARACVADDAFQCLVMMGLVDDGFPLDEMYSPQERRLLVLRQANRFRAFGEAVARCREGSTDGCDEAIHGYVDRWQDSRWAIPVLPDVRSSLLWYALEQGGEGAWGRLLDADPGDPLRALEAASRLDAGALARGWRAWLVEQRPATHAGLGSLTLGALFWTLLLVTFAARSKRCRLG
ncbi:MAG TPA: hypothetical protein VJ997_15250 [Longimicrobiales bacterium]|nr:hypothetical protein [Longimicrobiales bacterium]